jgi:hypothetical protein
MVSELYKKKKKKRLIWLTVLEAESPNSMAWVLVKAPSAASLMVGMEVGVMFGGGILLKGEL